MRDKDWTRLAVTALLLALLVYIVVEHYSAAVEQTVVNLAILAAGYWLGSSKGSSDKARQLEEHATGKPGDPVHVEAEE